MAARSYRGSESHTKALLVVLKTHELMAAAIQEQLKRRADLHRATDKAGEQLKAVQLSSTLLQV